MHIRADETVVIGSLTVIPRQITKFSENPTCAAVSDVSEKMTKNTSMCSNDTTFLEKKIQQFMHTHYDYFHFSNTCNFFLVFFKQTYRSNNLYALHL